MLEQMLLICCLFKSAGSGSKCHCSVMKLSLLSCIRTQQMLNGQLAPSRRLYIFYWQFIDDDKVHLGRCWRLGNEKPQGRAVGKMKWSITRIGAADSWSLYLYLYLYCEFDPWKLHPCMSPGWSSQHKEELLSRSTLENTAHG